MNDQRAGFIQSGLMLIAAGKLPVIRKTEEYQQEVISNDHACCGTGEFYTAHRHCESEYDAMMRTAIEFADDLARKNSEPQP